MKTFLFPFSLIFCLSTFISCSKEDHSFQFDEATVINTQTDPSSTASSRGLTSVYVTTFGYRGTAQNQNDCPTGMASCLFGDFMYRMESLEEGLDYIKNVDPAMVLGKLTFNGDNTLTLEMIATGVEYEHNDKKEEVLIVPKEGLLISGITKSVDEGEDVTVKGGTYKITDKEDAMFWSGIVTLILE